MPRPNGGIVPVEMGLQFSGNFRKNSTIICPAERLNVSCSWHVFTSRKVFIMDNSDCLMKALYLQKEVFIGYANSTTYVQQHFTSF